MYLLHFAIVYSFYNTLYEFLFKCLCLKINKVMLLIETKNLVWILNRILTGCMETILMNFVGCPRYYSKCNTINILYVPIIKLLKKIILRPKKKNKLQNIFKLFLIKLMIVFYLQSF